MDAAIIRFLLAGWILFSMAPPLNAAPPQTYNAQLEYLKVINNAGPAHDPQLIFLLLEQYLSTNQSEAGVSFFETLLDRHRSSMSPDQQSLYLAALGLLRATHAQDVFLLKRLGWVRETIAILETAKKLGGERGFVAHWAAGYVYTELPSWFGKQQDAREDLQWCMDHAAQAPNAGWMREVYYHLAVLSKRIDGQEKQTAELLGRAGYESLDDAHGFTTPFAVNRLTGNTFGSRRIREIVPHRIYVLSGFEFTEYYFVVSDDRKELVAIDAGTRPDSAQAAFEALNRQVPGLPPLTTVFITHAHWDHVGGHSYFRRLNPKVRFYARENYAQELTRSINAPAGNTYFFGSRFNLDMIRDFKPEVTIDKRTDVVIGGTPFQLIPVAGGETDDALFIHLPADSVLFVGDFMMPYFGAPFVEEGNIPGLFASIDTAVALQPVHLLHGHEPLTTLFDSTALLAQMKGHLQWLYRMTLQSISRGADRAAIHHLNLIPPDMLDTPAAQVPYLVMREHFIDRVYDQNVGYWQPGLAGLDQLSTKELGSVFSYYLALSDQQLASIAEKMLANGDLELAGKTVNQALGQYPESEALLRVKKETFLRLKQKYENFDPFKFIEYSEEIASDTKQMQ